MTSNEAKRKVETCEDQIKSAHNELKDNARTVGSSALTAAAGRTTRRTLLPLLLCLVGLICFSGPWFLGVLLIGFGIFLAYNLHAAAKDKEKSVESGKKALEDVINQNINI